MERVHVQYFPVRRVRRISGDGQLEVIPTSQRCGHERLPGESEEDYTDYLFTIPADQALLAIGDEMAKELTPASTRDK